MISIAIPKELIPTKDLHQMEYPVYRRGAFNGFRSVTFVALTDEFTMDDQFEDTEVFIDLSGNEFVKLIERDTLPSWATPTMLFEHSTACGSVNPETRKITWSRNKTNA